VLRAVLDTNVIVSGAITEKGTPFQLLRAWRAREWNLIISPYILGEVRRVLNSPKIAPVYALTYQDITDLIQLFQSRAVVVRGTLTIPRISRDCEDDHILACAKEGEADYIVSGDQDLLSLERYQGVPIVTPAAFAVFLRVAR